MRKCRFGKKKGTNRCRKRPLTGAALRSMRGLGDATSAIHAVDALRAHQAKVAAMREKYPKCRRGRSKLTGRCCEFGVSKVTGRCLKRARR
jgi:hypothetical protein